jgi:hypothetical protein
VRHHRRPAGRDLRRPAHHRHHLTLLEQRPLPRAPARHQSVDALPHEPLDVPLERPEIDLPVPGERRPQRTDDREALPHLPYPEHEISAAISSADRAGDGGSPPRSAIKGRAEEGESRQDPPAAA